MEGEKSKISKAESEVRKMLMKSEAGQGPAWWFRSGQPLYWYSRLLPSKGLWQR